MVQLREPRPIRRVEHTQWSIMLLSDFWDLEMLAYWVSLMAPLLTQNRFFFKQQTKFEAIIEATTNSKKANTNWTIAHLTLTRRVLVTSLPHSSNRGAQVACWFRKLLVGAKWKSGLRFREPVRFQMRPDVAYLRGGVRHFNFEKTHDRA